MGTIPKFSITKPKQAKHKGKLAVTIYGELYHVAREKFAPEMHFRCGSRRSSGCSASVRINKEGRVAAVDGNHHCHWRDNYKRRYWAIAMKIATENPQLSNEDIYLAIERQAQLERIPPKHEPKKVTVKRAIFNMRLGDMPTDPDDVFDITLDNTKFAGLKLFEYTWTDAKGKDQRMVACGSTMNLWLFVNSKKTCSDGTYASRSAKHFAQLYCLHGQLAPETQVILEDDMSVRTRNTMRPMIYVFTTCKTKESYLIMLRKLREVVAERFDFGEHEWDGPESWITDFESAASSAIKEVK